MQFLAKINGQSLPMWTTYVMVPEEISEHFIKTLQTRRVKMILENTIYQVALHPDGNGCFALQLSKGTMKKHQLEIGSSVSITLEEDHSKYGIYCCEEFEELLKIDFEGSEYFHQLTPGKQRSLIHIISKLKSEQKRIEKGLVVLDHLKNQNGKLDYEILREDFKNANKRF